MKDILIGTFAAFVLGAAIVNAQTPSQQGGQIQPGQDKSGTQTQTTRQDDRVRTKNTAVTYRGYLKGSEAAGYTISPLPDRTTGRAPAGATVGTSGAATTTYSVVAGEGAKVDFTKMTDQCVEITGTLAPEMEMHGGASAASASGRTGSGASATGAGNVGGQSAAGVGNIGGGAGVNPDAGAGGADSTARSTGGLTTGQRGATGGADATAGAAGHAQMHRTLTVTRIRAVQGGCSQ